MEILQRLLSLIQSLFKKTPQAEPKVILPELTPKIDLEDAGVQLIQYYEKCHKKLPSGLIAPYLDGKGVPTIGWGNTYWEDGKSVTMADAPITKARADALFRFIHASFASRVAAALPQHTSKTDLGVFTSLAYNIGIEAFTHNSTARKAFMLGDRAKSGASIEWYNKSGGKVEKGLQRRRRAEHYVFDGMAVAKAIAQAELDYP